MNPFLPRPTGHSWGTRNILSRILATAVLIALAVIALFFGAIIVAVLIGLGAMVFLFLYLRSLWIRHQLGLDVHPHHSRDRRDEGITLEGEYTVEEKEEHNQ